MDRIMLDKIIFGILGNIAQMGCLGQKGFVQVGCVWVLKNSAKAYSWTKLILLSSYYVQVGQTKPSPL